MTATQGFRGITRLGVRSLSVRLLALLRPEERLPTACAVLTVFLVMVAHALVETSRDALFLANLPARHLPWVYLALAALAIFGCRVVERAGGPDVVWRGLMIAQLAAALGTLLFLVLLREPASWVFYALYLWGGLASMLILIRFWLLLSGRMTVAQAKRLFPMIAAGPVLGMLTGFALAGVVGDRVGPAGLLAASSVFFLLSAAVGVSLRRAFCPEPTVSGSSLSAAKQERFAAFPQPSLSGSLGLILRDAYLLRVSLVLLAASVTSTLADYAFKTAVSNSVAAHDLSTFFARTYFFFNLLSVAVLALVMPFVRLVGVPASLAVQPALLALGALLWSVVGGLPAVLFLRGADVGLRWSLHKTATELLYVPMSARLRSTVKAISDVVAHRGGQAAASLAILALLAVHAPEWVIGVAIVSCASAWIYAAASLRQPYLDLFRDTLRAQFVQTRIDFPELDVASLETLIAALSSADDHEVTAAMELLNETGRLRLVPALILYHPSPAVVVRALDLFQSAGRQDFLPLTDRLLSHADPFVRAAVIRASARARPDRDMLQRASESPCPAVAATALTALAAHNWADPESTAVDLARRVEADDKLGLYVALAASVQPSAALRPLLTRLCSVADARTRREAVRAIGAIGDAGAIAMLIGRLSDRDTREDARATLLALGEPAFVALKTALQDLDLDHTIRIHLPRTIARFGDQRAADLLLTQLLAEPRGMVRYKILRGLGRMVSARPELRLDAALLDRVIDQHISHACELLHWSVMLDAGAAAEPALRTTGRELLRQLIGDKFKLTIERLFRVLGLRYRHEDIAQLYRGLVDDEPALRASSRELLAAILPMPMRALVVALTDDAPESVRLAAAAAHHETPAVGYATLIDSLSRQHSQSVSYLAAFHANELGLVDAGAGTVPTSFDTTLALRCARGAAITTLEPVREVA